MTRCVCVCVVNKDMAGKQCTIWMAWCMTSRFHSCNVKIVESIVDLLDKEYMERKVPPLVINSWGGGGARLVVHEYLGMTIDFFGRGRGQGKVLHAGLYQSSSCRGTRRNHERFLQ